MYHPPLYSMRPSSPVWKTKPCSCRRGSIDDVCCREEACAPRYAFIYPPASDGLVMSSAGSLSHRSWHVKREICEKGARCAIRARSPKFSRASKGFPQLVKSAQSPRE